MKRKSILCLLLALCLCLTMILAACKKDDNTGDTPGGDTPGTDPNTPSGESAGKKGEVQYFPNAGGDVVANETNDQLEGWTIRY